MLRVTRSCLDAGPQHCKHSNKRKKIYLTHSSAQTGIVNTQNKLSFFFDLG